MEQKGNSIDGEARLRQPGRFPSVGVAIAAGAFSLVVAVLLFMSQLNQKTYRGDADLDQDPIFVEQLMELKVRLAKNPRDETLKQELRQLDLEIRDRYFAAQDFIRRGAYLLLLGMAVFVLSLKRAVVVRKLPPLPSREAVEADQDAAGHALGRRAVTVTGLALLGGVLALAAMETIELVIPERPAVAVAEWGGGSEASNAGTPETSETPEISGTRQAPPSLEEIARNWSRFRGPGGLGISPYLNLPEKWDGESGEAILWKTEIPLPGHNSPVVWGKRVFLTAADEVSKEVYCFHADTGEILWQQPVENVTGVSAEELNIMEDTGYAASTMACDNARVYAIFVDGDVVCFDFEGNRLWIRNMGPQDNTYGYATSLTFYNELLLIQYDQGVDDDDLSVLFALDVQTGSMVWKHVRPVAGSWTSPIVIDTAIGAQVITCSDPLVIACEPTTGKVLWQANLMGTDVAPSPIYANGLVFVIQPYSSLFALRPDGQGDVTETHLAWTVDCGAPDICSPVSNGELIFLLTSDGAMTCIETETGNLVWEEELDADFQASPSLVGEWILLLTQDGEMIRVKAARNFERSETVSKLGEMTLASPAFAEGRIYIRGELNLFCIGKE
jgi:outer membrane protein assembly factor BamB